jgi:hypothetical protein
VPHGVVKGIIAPNWLVFQLPWLAQSVRGAPSSTMKDGRLTGRNTYLDDFVISLYFALIVLAIGVVALFLGQGDEAGSTTLWAAAAIMALPTGHFIGWWIGEVLTSGAAVDAVQAGRDPWNALVAHTVAGWGLVLVISVVFRYATS